MRDSWRPTLSISGLVDEPAWRRHSALAPCTLHVLTDCHLFQIRLSRTRVKSRTDGPSSGGKCLTQVRVRVRSGDYEFEVECGKEDIGTILSLTDQLIETLGKLRGTSPLKIKGTKQEEAVSAEEEVTTVASEEIPQITSTTLPDAVTELLASPWGREPRTAREVKDALEVNALHYPVTTVHPQLIRMTRTGKLRRLKKGDLYSYVLVKKPSVESD